MVKISVDLDYREKLKRLHTATHILNYVLRKVLGNHVWQNGSDLRYNFATLDVTHYENLSDKELFQIQKLCNNMIFENHKVSVLNLNRVEAERKYGFGLYQGGAVPLKDLRIVKIEDFDVEACGGIHVDFTSQIGFMKIVESHKIQDGVIRIKFVVHDFALEEVFKKDKVIFDLKDLFLVDQDSILKTANKFFLEWKLQKKEIEKLKDENLNLYFNLIKDLEDNFYKLENDNLDMKFLLELFLKILNVRKSFKLSSNKFILASCDFKVDNFKKKIDKKDFNIYIL